MSIYPNFKGSKVYRCTLGVFHLIKTVYELLDNPSYLCKSSFTMYNIREGYGVYFSCLCKKYKDTGPKWLCQIVEGCCRKIIFQTLLCNSDL